jgi:hypothetical protein
LNIIIELNESVVDVFCVEKSFVEILNSIEFTWPCAGQGKIRICSEHFSLGCSVSIDFSIFQIS